ncbi:alpha/beta fold hydrolase [Phaeobacter porticola]|uniref:Pimelyl-[acyl-carrier protein] methyl ester esterase n=1 Tax=Phaeobacter porticola TaxID=1844006 RepID=A0A1L3I813_9RHOB|nr:alpha/beta fold hydrolase [Phaeobacter porticola]APG48274.1 pimelyl-[acyl-carrier protein] methyl ester esterase [Phaeobacter porticola]
MTDLLLVHGSCHGAWCWRDLLPELSVHGIRARTIDLPGHDQTPGAPLRDPATITLAETAEAIAEASRPETIVLGHSWAGYPITAAADLGKQLRGLIYLCAYVPKPGLSMIDMRKAGPRQTLTGRTVTCAKGASYHFTTDAATDLLYPDCKAETVDYALTRLTAQPIGPQDTPLTPGTVWQETPKAYIRSTEDRVIPPEYQAQMVAGWPRDRVLDLQTSHSPFFAAPQRLAGMIATLTKDL